MPIGILTIAVHNDRFFQGREERCKGGRKYSFLIGSLGYYSFGNTSHLITCFDTIKFFHSSDLDRHKLERLSAFTI